MATSLGIGAQQVNAGLSFLFGIGNGTGTQVCLIAGITMLATASVMLGLDAGIRRLSEWNIALAMCLMLLVVMGSGFVDFCRASVENLGAYLRVLPINSFRTGVFDIESRSWLSSWTIFYWAWWISWSPFVGIFIARVSRGRTIREFIAGVVFVPTAAGLLWLTAFGTTTLRQHTDHLDRVAQGKPTAALRQYWVGTVDEQGQLEIQSDGTFAREKQPLTAVEYLATPIVTQDGTTRIDTLPTVLFVLLDGLFRWPLLVKLAVGIATLCIVLFFVTSSDSASMVIDIIASGGNPNPPAGTRLFWALTEGIVAAALLVAGGLRALQAASIAAALPFSLILLMSCASLVRALREEDRNATRHEPDERSS